MHHSGHLPKKFEGPEQGFEGKNCQNMSQGKPCMGLQKLHGFQHDNIQVKKKKKNL